jgi:hypothetical protein
MNRFTCVGYANSMIRRGAALTEKQSPNPTANMVSVEIRCINTTMLTDDSSTDENRH